MKSTHDYLTDILLYITRIEDVAKHGKANFVANYLFHDAVIREYEVIGEIIKRLPPELLMAQSGVNCRTFAQDGRRAGIRGLRSSAEIYHQIIVGAVDTGFFQFLWL